MPLNAIFLSANVPDPERDRKYFDTGNSIRDAVIALVSIVLPHTRLVFGGHPAITAMVKWVADRLGGFNRVRMFQSKFFRELYIQDIQVFSYKEINSVGNSREQSLEAMRKSMLLSEKMFSGAFFIGGMEGAEKEYAMVRQLLPRVPRFPVATTGAAAEMIWRREYEALHEVPAELRGLRRQQLEELKTGTAYLALFMNFLAPNGDTSFSGGSP